MKNNIGNRPRSNGSGMTLVIIFAFVFGISSGLGVVWYATRLVRKNSTAKPAAEARRPRIPQSSDTGKEPAKDLASPETQVRHSAAIQKKEADEPGAARACIEALHDDDLDVRRSAAANLGKAREEIAAVRSALRAALSDPDAGVRCIALDSLRRLAPAPDASGSDWKDSEVRALVRILKDDSRSARLQAATALGEIGPAAAAAVPALFDAIRDEGDPLRAAAMKSVVSIGRTPPTLLIEELNGGDKALRLWAREQMARCERDAVPALVEALRHTSPIVREAAARALGRAGSDAPEAVPALVNAAKDPDADVRSSARSSLAQMREVSPSALIDVVRDGDSCLRDWAIRGLERAGDAALPELLAGLKDRRARRFCAELLLRRGGHEAACGGQGARAAIPAVRDELADPEGDRFWAAGVLVSFGETQTAIAFYVEQLRDGPGLRPAQAAAELRTLGTASVPALRPLLSSRDAKLRIRTVELLGEIGSGAVPALVDGLKSDDMKTREAVARALGKIGAHASEAAPALYSVLDDPEWQVRQAATDALKKIQTN